MKLLLLFLCNCWLAAGSTIDSQTLKNLIVQSSGLSADQIEKIKFENFNFDVGVVGSPKIITSMKGGSVSLKWSDERNSLIRIRVFAQKRYDNYVEDLVLPMALFQGIPSNNVNALLDDDKLKDSWRTGKITDIGNYCVGQHLPGLGNGIVNAGFFFYDEYGFCVQVSASKDSGVTLDSVEEMGRGVIEEIAKAIKQESVTPNPFNKAEAFAFTRSVSNSEKTAEAIKIQERETRPPKPDHKPAPVQNPQSASRGGFWVIGLGAVVVLLATLLVWWQTRKKSP